MKELRIYQTSLELIKEVYTLIGSNQNLQRDFSLVDQLKRASVSVTANIAEGYQRTPKHNKYFLTISSGSTNEMVALLEVVSLIYQIDTNDLQNKYQLLGKQINAFSKTLKTLIRKSTTETDC